MHLSDAPASPACPSRASGWELRAPAAWGLPCCSRPPLRACRRQYPGRIAGCCRRLARQRRPSPFSGRVGSCIKVFGACSAFTCVTACMLAGSPRRPLPESFDGFVTSAAAPIASGWNDQFAGWDSHPLEYGAFPRHTLEQPLCSMRGHARTRRETGVFWTACRPAYASVAGRFLPRAVRPRAQKTGDVS
jgi:hypothetical protein